MEVLARDLKALGLYAARSSVNTTLIVTTNRRTDCTVFWTNFGRATRS